MVKNLPLRQETQVQSLGQKDLREKDMATHSSILAWSIPRPGYSPWGRKESDMTEWLSHTAIVTLLYIVLYYVWSFNHVWLFETPWTVAHQAPLSMRILQVRILEWVAMPSSRGFSHTEIEPRSPTLQVDSLPSKPPGKPKNNGVGSLSLLQGISLTQGSTRVSCIEGGVFASWIIRETPCSTLRPHDSFVLQVEICKFCLPSCFSLTLLPRLHLWQPPTCPMYLRAW